MDLLRESRYIMHLSIIILVYWLGWLCGLVFGQVGEVFTGSANIPDIELTCIANLAAFFQFILKDKLWFEAQGKRLAAYFPKVEKLKHINGLEVLTTCSKELRECSVVMLSFHKPSWNTRQFMRLMYNLYDVHSIFLQCHPLQSAAVTVCVSTCTENHRCGCIVFNTVEDITMMLARRMPGTVKRLSDSLCLLPSLRCLRKGCHGCNQGLLHVENDRLREGDSQVESPAAVCGVLHLKSIHKVRTCICIPTCPASEDEWTNKLIRFFDLRDKEFRGAVIRKGRTNASSALENYKNRDGECEADEKYSLASLAIVPDLTEALIPLVLIFWLKVDGFSSILFANRAVKGYIYENDPHRFLIRARVKSNANKTNVCQVLLFRNALQNWIFVSFQIVTFLICSISWIVLVALEGGVNKWYHTHSMPPSEGRIIVIMVAICIALVMDGFDLKLYLQIRRMPRFRGSNHTLLICETIVLEILCIVLCTVIIVRAKGILCIVPCSSISRVRVMGIKVFGRWIYSVLQCLVWLKWGIGRSIMSDIRKHSLSQDSPDYGDPTWWYATCGWSIFCSAFLLNATLAGVRAKWHF